MGKIWQFFLMFIILVILGSFILWLSSPKHIVRYDLDRGYQDGIPRINADVENGSDYTIPLSKEVSWEQAIRMVDSLNMILKKYPVK
jgi:hypothetical protein